jgi:3'-phosphoadenosine 5'-phosphosulfate sulfotransferase (PAPS reductase)/FAD synthetase
MTRSTAPAGIALIDQAIVEHAPIAVYAMFSGGHDSLVSTHLTSTHPRFSGAVHINTGIGIRQTREYVRETCAVYGWPLLELSHAGNAYEQMVTEAGFPYGEIPHRFAYIRLKERLVARLIREAKVNPLDRVVLVTGVRRQESKRRKGTVEPIKRVGCTVWVAPIADMSDSEKAHYIDANELPRNPVVDHLHMSGECLCGAYATDGELEMIRFFYPDAAAEIECLQRKVATETAQWPNWGTRRPQNWKDIASGAQPYLPLCQSCPTRWESNG